jgi:hypothetical protein
MSRRCENVSQAAPHNSDRQERPWPIVADSHWRTARKIGLKKEGGTHAEGTNAPPP